MIQMALILIVAACICLAILACSEGWAWLSFRRYGGRCAANICAEVPFTLDMSKGTVEQQMEDGSFQRILSTEDRNVGHQPFYYFLFEKRRVQYVLTWEAEGTLWRGHYRYLKKKGALPVDGTVELRYQTGKPWRYAIQDPALWRALWIKLAAYGLVLAVGIVLLVRAAG